MVPPAQNRRPRVWLHEQPRTVTPEMRPSKLAQYDRQGVATDDRRLASTSMARRSVAEICADFLSVF
jgi:hypothetical protein